MKKSELAEYIKKIIEQVRVEGHDCAVHDDEGQDHEEWEEEQEDGLEEMTTTANADGYMTPHAFSDNDEDEHKKKIKSTAEVFDFKSTENEKKNTVSLKEGKSLYHRYRDADDMKPRQKIGISIREINRLLGDVEKLVNINSRFKSELNVPSDGYWKRTKKQLAKVDERLIRISRKIRNMR